MVSKKKSRTIGALRAALYVGGYLVFIGLLFGVFAFALSMLSAPNTIGVVIGIGALIILIMALVGLGAWARRELMKHLGVVMIAMSALGATGCGYERIDPGYIGIKVPLVGDDRGEAYPIVTGRVYYNPWTHDVYEWPTFQQRQTWHGTTAITVSSSESASITCHVGAAVHFDGAKVPDLFRAYRLEPATLLDGIVRDRVRQAMNYEAAKYPAAGLLSTDAEAWLKASSDRVTAEFTPQGIIFDTPLSLLSRCAPDARVEQAINDVLQKKQEALKETEQTTIAHHKADQAAAAAEGAKRAAIEAATGEAESIRLRAQAQADANRIVAESLTSPLLEWEAITKWNGALPGWLTSGAATPFVSVPSK